MKQPKVWVFNLPQFKDPYVIIKLRNKTYQGFYFKPKIHLRKDCDDERHETIEGA